MPNKKLSIIGSVGIPANYGGFETLVEFLTRYITLTFDTTVYCSSKQYPKPRLKTYNNAQLKYVSLKANGFQSIPYDIIGIIRAYFNTDVFLILGVAGSFMFPFIRLTSNKIIIINIDGLEHKRAKWNKLAKWYLKLAEKIAVKFAHYVIADNQAIADYVTITYGCTPQVIAYGGDHITYEQLTSNTIEKYHLPEKYAFSVCRIEPENNIHIILDAFAKAQKPMVIIGNWQYSEYGKDLYQKFCGYSNIRLIDPIYDQKLLNQIRSNCSLYIHGHSAGGTNPSLVEAMHLKLPIVAFDVSYNRFTTNKCAYFFVTTDDLVQIIMNDFSTLYNKKLIEECFSYSEHNYTWENIATKYLGLMQ